MSTSSVRLRSAAARAARANLVISHLAVAGGLTALKESIRRDRWKTDPAAWIRERVGHAPWSKQAEICAAIAAHRRVAVPSAFGTGKSWLMAHIVAWWLDVHALGSAFAVTTATTAAQVRAILWREISRVHASANLAGRLNQTEWWVEVDDGREEMIAFGRKPADMDPTAFQGIHAEHVLVVADEAGGLGSAILDAAEGLIVNEHSRIIAPGNPLSADTPFGKICQPGSGWTVIPISAFDTPAFTGERISAKAAASLISRSWVDDRRVKWGETSTLYVNKVLGRFTEHREDGLIRPEWVSAAQSAFSDSETIHRAGVLSPRVWLALSPVPVNPDVYIPRVGLSYGVDVGGGRDESTVAGYDADSKIGGILLRTKDPDTMALLESVIDLARIARPESIFVDYIGIGRGIVDRARQIARDQSPEISELVREICRRIVGVEVGRTSAVDGFVNVRAHASWSLAEMFRDGQILLPPDDILAVQLLDLRFFRVGGRIQIESKDDLRRRVHRSPDDADALMLATVGHTGAIAPSSRGRVGVWGRQGANS